MMDERDSEDGGGDGLDAWLAAHFSGQQETPPAATPPPVVPPAVIPPVAPPAATPPVFPPVFPPTVVSPPVNPPVVNPPTVALPPSLPPVDVGLSGAPEEPSVPADLTEAFSQDAEPSALESLFGETKFRDYEAEPGPSQNPFLKTVVLAPTTGSAESVDPVAPRSTKRGPREPIPGPQKTLMWIAGSLLAVLIFGALFLAGTKLSNLLGPAPAVIVSPTITPTPTPTALPLGPVKPGEYHWDELLGGECVDPYNGPWEDNYTVVDCTKPHPAQLVTRGVFGPDDEFLTPYPGLEELQSRVNLLCTAPTAINYAAAGAYNDIQFEASYAPNQQEWVDGNRDYYCFVTRASRAELTGSIAVPQVAPVPPTAPPAVPAP